MTKNFTAVEIVFYPEYLNFWLRFGVPDVVHKLDRRRSLALFRPGQIFGYVRWRANEFGTQVWRFAIAQAMEPPSLVSRLPGVLPGAEILLLTTGKSRVKRALAIVDQLENHGVPPENVSPSYYRHLQIRIVTGQNIRAYSAGQHDAHLAARRIGR